MFMVVYDDGECICVPMGSDRDCAGALECVSEGEDLVIFETRAMARRAIDISTHYAKLCKLQGIAVNEDFLPENKKNVKIRKCVFVREKE